MLRGRERSEDAIFTWYVDEFRPVNNLITDRTVHGTLPMLIGDTLGARGPVHYVKWAGPIEALTTFPVIVFAYTCHQNMFGILNEIADASHGPLD